MQNYRENKLHILVSYTEIHSEKFFTVNSVRHLRAKRILKKKIKVHLMQNRFSYILEYKKKSLKNANINLDYPCYEKCKPN